MDTMTPALFLLGALLCYFAGLASAAVYFHIKQDLRDRKRLRELQ